MYNRIFSLIFMAISDDSMPCFFVRRGEKSITYSSETIENSLVTKEKKNVYLNVVAVTQAKIDCKRPGKNTSARSPVFSL